MKFLTILIFFFFMSLLCFSPVLLEAATESSTTIDFDSISLKQNGVFDKCGPNGVCNMSDFLVCECPLGFKPNKVNGSNFNGCVKNTALECGVDGFFLALKNVKLSETQMAFVNKSRNLYQCRDMCEMNCSCTAYTNADVIQGIDTGCIIITGNLTDMRLVLEGGQNLFIRLSASELGSAAKRNHTGAYVLIAISACTVVLLLVFGIRMSIHKRKAIVKSSNLEQCLVDSLDPLEFKFNIIRTATRNFSEDNKLGEGRSAEVFKGILEDGQEIAVKRFSKTGLMCFKAEFSLLARLQHENLAKVLGFSLSSKEDILIVYEYLQNLSLDRYLFDSKKRSSFNWQTRFKVIVGIARGLVYLHQDLTILHRDLKPSNILLDENMNPKISDIALTHLFRVDQSQDDTAKILELGVIWHQSL